MQHPSQFLRRVWRRKDYLKHAETAFPSLSFGRMDTQEKRMKDKTTRGKKKRRKREMEEKATRWKDNGGKRVKGDRKWRTAKEGNVGKEINGKKKGRLKARGRGEGERSMRQGRKEI